MSKNTGVMVALYPHTDLATALTVDGGEPTAELHVTLGYFGSVDEITTEQAEALYRVTEAWAKQYAPMDGSISGMGIFQEGDEPVTYASVDVPILPDARQALVEMLTEAGIAPKKNHGYTPHITLAYEALPEVPVATGPTTFSQVSVVVADERTDFDFTGTEALVASVIIDSLGRRWDPLKHPRDRKGRFIETFSEVRGFFRKGGTEPDIAGRVVSVDRNGTVIVEVSGISPGSAEAAKRGIKNGDLVTLDLKQVEKMPMKARLDARGKSRNLRSGESKSLRKKAAWLRSTGNPRLAEAASLIDSALRKANHPDLGITQEAAGDLEKASLLIDDVRSEELGDGNYDEVKTTARQREMHETFNLLRTAENRLTGNTTVDNAVGGGQAGALQRAGQAKAILEQKALKVDTGEIIRQPGEAFDFDGIRKENRGEIAERMIEEFQAGGLQVQPRALNGLDRVAPVERERVVRVGDRQHVDINGEAVAVGTLVNVEAGRGKGGGNTREQFVGVVTNIRTDKATGEKIIKVRDVRPDRLGVEGDYHSDYAKFGYRDWGVRSGAITTMNPNELEGLRALMGISSDDSVADITEAIRAIGGGRRLAGADARRIAEIARNGHVEMFFRRRRAADNRLVGVGDWVYSAEHDSYAEIVAIEPGTNRLRVSFKNGLGKARINASAVTYAHGPNRAIFGRDDVDLLEGHGLYLPTRDEAAGVASSYGLDNAAKVIADPESTPEQIAEALRSDENFALVLANALAAKDRSYDALSKNGNPDPKDSRLLQDAAILGAASGAYFRKPEDPAEAKIKAEMPASPAERAPLPDPERPSVPEGWVQDPENPAAFIGPEGDFAVEQPDGNIVVNDASEAPVASWEEVPAAAADTDSKAYQPESPEQMGFDFDEAAANADFEERAALLRPYTETGPDYIRGVADELRTAERLQKDGRGEEAQYFLDQAEKALARRKPAPAPEPEADAPEADAPETDAEITVTPEMDGRHINAGNRETPAWRLANSLSGMVEGYYKNAVITAKQYREGKVALNDVFAAFESGDEAGLIEAMRAVAEKGGFPQAQRDRLDAAIDDVSKRGGLFEKFMANTAIDDALKAADAEGISPAEAIEARAAEMVQRVPANRDLPQKDVKAFAKEVGAAFKQARALYEEGDLESVALLLTGRLAPLFDNRGLTSIGDYLRKAPINDVLGVGGPTLLDVLDVDKENLAADQWVLRAPDGGKYEDGFAAIYPSRTFVYDDLTPENLDAFFEANADLIEEDGATVFMSIDADGNIVLALGTSTTDEGQAGLLAELTDGYYFDNANSAWVKVPDAGEADVDPDAALEAVEDIADGMLDTGDGEIEEVATPEGDDVLEETDLAVKVKVSKAQATAIMALALPEGEPDPALNLGEYLGDLERLVQDGSVEPDRAKEVAELLRKVGESGTPGQRRALTNLSWKVDAVASDSTNDSEEQGDGTDSGGPAGLPGADGGSGEGVGDDAEAPGGLDGLGDRDGSGSGLVINGREVAVAGQIELNDDQWEILNAAGKPTPVFFEIDPFTESNTFRDAISGLKEGNEYAAAVYVYDADEYAGMRLFLSPDGASGFALKGDEIVSLFANPATGGKGHSAAAMLLAVQEGGRRLDAFDTVLPGIYAMAGFRPVARVKWDDEYAPEGWDYEVFGEFNGGRPDVVFMAFEDGYKGPYDPTEGEYVDDYDAGVEAAKKAAGSGTDTEGDTNGDGDSGNPPGGGGDDGGVPGEGPGGAGAEGAPEFVQESLDLGILTPEPPAQASFGNQRDADEVAGALTAWREDNKVQNAIAEIPSGRIYLDEIDEWVADGADPSVADVYINPLVAELGVRGRFDVIQTLLAAVSGIEVNNTPQRVFEQSEFKALSDLLTAIPVAIGAPNLNPKERVPLIGDRMTQDIAPKIATALAIGDLDDIRVRAALNGALRGIQDLRPSDTADGKFFRPGDVEKALTRSLARSEYGVDSDQYSSVPRFDERLLTADSPTGIPAADKFDTPEGIARYISAMGVDAQNIGAEINNGGGSAMIGGLRWEFQSGGFLNRSSTFRVTGPDGGTYVVKSLIESSAKAELSTINLYRSLGLDSPRTYLLGDSTGIYDGDRPRTAILIDWAGRDADAPLNDVELGGQVAYSGLDFDAPEAIDKALGFSLLNGLLGNTDRHGGNFFVGFAEDGTARFIGIDQEFAWKGGRKADADMMAGQRLLSAIGGNDAWALFRKWFNGNLSREQRQAREGQVKDSLVKWAESVRKFYEQAKAQGSLPQEHMYFLERNLDRFNAYNLNEIAQALGLGDLITDEDLGTANV